MINTKWFIGLGMSVVLLGFLSAAPAAVVLQMDIDDAGSNDVQAGFERITVNDGGYPNATKTFSGGITVDIDPVGAAFGGQRHRTAPVDGGSLTQAAIYRDFIFMNGDSPSVGLDTTITGLTPYREYTATVWSFDRSSVYDRVSDWYVVGASGQQPAALDYTFNGSIPPTADADNRFSFTAQADATGQLVIEARGDTASYGSSPAVFFNGLQLDQQYDLAIDFNARSATGQAYTQPGFDEFVLTSTSSTTHTFGQIDVTVSDATTTGGNKLSDRHRWQPTDSGAFTEQELLRDFVFCYNTRNDDKIDVLIEGLMPGELHEVTLWSFDDGSGPTRTSDWYANGQLVFDDYQFNGYDVPPAPPSNDTYSFSFLVDADSFGNILITGEAQDSDFVFLNAMTVMRIPEPSTFVLWAMGALGMALVGWRRRGK